MKLARLRARMQHVRAAQDANLQRLLTRIMSCERFVTILAERCFLKRIGLYNVPTLITPLSNDSPSVFMIRIMNALELQVGTYDRFYVVSNAIYVSISFQCLMCVFVRVERPLFHPDLGESNIKLS